MPQGRPEIPAETKRQIRQRCGFGCAVCGMPLITYEHITPWAKKKEHDPDDMTLLCPRHQRESTDEVLSKEQIRAANATPYNIRQGRTTAFALPFQTSNVITMHLGGDTFTSQTGTIIPLVIDDEPLLAFQVVDGQLLLHIRMRDEFNRLVLAVTENELAIDPSSAWDVRFEGGLLTVNEAKHKIFAKLRFQGPSTVTVERARFLCNGVEIGVTADEIVSRQVNVIAAGNAYDNMSVGYVFGHSQRYRGVVGVPNINRYAARGQTEEPIITLQEQPTESTG